MPNTWISPDIVTTAQTPYITHVVPRASLFTRFVARLRADRLDADLAVGVPVPDGGPLAAHAARLMSARERESVAHSLHRALEAARRGNDLMSGRIPVDSANVLAAERLIDAVRLQLLSGRPVHVRGMARLRRVLSDGTGPLYRGGSGDLPGRLGAALAEL